jgi:membrane protein DedA with SNARE-associated domain
MCPTETTEGLALVLGIIAVAFLSEDGATVTAATFAASCLLDVKLAFLSAFCGLWIGDLSVYAIARHAGPSVMQHRWFSRMFSALRSLPGPSSRRAWELALSRFFPGTRLPSYLTAGLTRMPIWLFTTITAITAFLWTLVVFFVIHFAPTGSTQLASRLPSLVLLGLCLFTLLSAWRIWGPKILARLQLVGGRFSQWEFWPAWIFYPPVAVYCMWQGIRHGSFSLPTVANVNQKNGGIIGESKIGILSELTKTFPEVTADAFLIEAGSIATRMDRVTELCVQHKIAMPFVLKPDTAQRGAGFKKIQAMDEARAYLSQVSVPVVLQRYVAAPKEAGIFYYRFPGEAKGRVLGITRKMFPHVTGDGIRTVRELIEADPRARLIAHTYLKRFGTEAERIFSKGERFRLVEAGNHCQGCEFQDGSDLFSEQLLNTFDFISQNLCGFFVGRFDVRYWDDDELRAGKNFQIIELNGAASEATNIYDSHNSLWSAYGTLFRQWRIVFAIGAANRRRGFQPPSPYAVWRDWREFTSQACEFPLAD